MLLTFDGKKIGVSRTTSKCNNDADFPVLIIIIYLVFVLFEDLDVPTDLLDDELSHEVSLLLDWFEKYYVGRKKSKINLPQHTGYFNSSRCIKFIILNKF